mgnify:CR=1 FL=1
MGAQSIRLEKTDAISRVVLSCPPLNILDIPALRQLSALLESLQKDSCKVVVLAAQGKAFSAGVDVKDHTVDKVHEMIATLHKVFEALWALPQPTVAAVQGMALGGGMELAIACDMVIASERAEFGQPEIQLGVIPPVAALLLPRLIGRKKALELIFTGERITAREAHALGLVNRVVDAEHFEKELAAFVEKLIALSGPVVKLAKKAVYLPLDRDLPRMMERVEQLYLDELMKLEDAQEGLRAFLEKRKPQWQKR